MVAIRTARNHGCHTFERNHGCHTHCANLRQPYALSEIAAAIRAERDHGCHTHCAKSRLPYALSEIMAAIRPEKTRLPYALSETTAWIATTNRGHLERPASLTPHTTMKLVMMSSALSDFTSCIPFAKQMSPNGFKIALGDCNRGRSIRREDTPSMMILVCGAPLMLPTRCLT
jgi:hypothetical protein